MSKQPIPRGSNVTGVVFLFLARGVLGLLGVGALFVALQGDLAAYVSWTPLAVLAMGAVALLSIGVARLVTIASFGFSSTLVLTLAVCFAGFGTIGCQGALNASAGLIYPPSCRTTGVGAALGLGRIGSLAGPLVGGMVLDSGVPVQQMFYVPVLPLGVAMIATLVLVLRKVDVRGEAGAAH